MRLRMINYLKSHATLLRFGFRILRCILLITYLFPIRKKQIIFASFGGRKFDDSPRAIYDEICRRREFEGWRLIWAFVDPEQVSIPRGEKVKIDTVRFFLTLFTSRVWVSNSGMDRGLQLRNPRIIRIETWHGTPLKKICGEENSKEARWGIRLSRPDRLAIRCAQSEYDLEILSRVLQADKNAFLMADLPRNDELKHFSAADCAGIRNKLSIPPEKKVILYMPTYREYLINENRENYIAPPISMEKWEKLLGDEYVLLIRAHYAVSAALELHDSDFLRDVSAYEKLNELYEIADLLISDYSSAFVDYSILGRPMLCFAYDLAEYEEKRGLYLDLSETLPCEICRDEDTLLQQIQELDTAAASDRTAAFCRRFAPYAGNAAKAVADELQRRLYQ